jgi:predicted transcriptional regulator
MTLREWREDEAILLQEDIGEKTGFGKAYICRLELGQIHPSVKFKRNFITAFGKEAFDKIDEFKKGA